MKRPSSAPPLKRPAAAGTAPGNAVKALKSEVEKYKHQEDAELEDKEGDLARDKMKAEKWARMKAAGALPEYLVNLYEEEAKHSPLGKRRFQTELINKLFVKRNGQWEMDVSDVQFRSHKALCVRGMGANLGENPVREDFERTSREL